MELDDMLKSRLDPKFLSLRVWPIITAQPNQQVTLTIFEITPKAKYLIKIKNIIFFIYIASTYIIRLTHKWVEDTSIK